MRSKNSTWNLDFYFAIIKGLKYSTNLSKIQKKLNISKQQLNYYLRRLKKFGIIIKKGRGWYELTKKSKNLTKYGFFLKKDMIRGHGFIWTIKLSKIPENWEKRIEILKSRNVNYKLVGAKGSTPRIKVLGRKIWLCNNHLRIFDKNSYYGTNAVESRYLAFQEIKTIVGALNNKLGLFLKPSHIVFKREHYALIKNDLAIEENRKGNIIRIKDKEGEWLLIDDSLGEGGELENIGKKAFPTNISMQKWWNDNKKNNFQVTPSFILKTFGDILKTETMNMENILKHQKVLDEMLVAMKELKKGIKEFTKVATKKE